MNNSASFLPKQKPLAFIPRFVPAAHNQLLYPPRYTATRARAFTKNVVLFTGSSADGSGRPPSLVHGTAPHMGAPAEGEHTTAAEGGEPTPDDPTHGDLADAPAGEGEQGEEKEPAHAKDLTVKTVVRGMRRYERFLNGAKTEAEDTRANLEVQRINTLVGEARKAVKTTLEPHCSRIWAANEVGGFS